MPIHRLSGFLLLFGCLYASAALLQAQDTRDVAEPSYPPTCSVYHAPLVTTANGPGVGSTVAEQDAVSDAETKAIKNLLKNCKEGQALELAIGNNGANSAFLINPIVLPEYVSLIVDGGVTVYGSRDPGRYQDQTTSVCGTIGHYKINTGCRPLITLSSNTGIYGNGVIDGQGDKSLLSGRNAGATWWDLTLNKKDTTDPSKPCVQPNPTAPGVVGDPTSDSSACEQSSPLVLSSADIRKSTISNLILYKFTVRNPPYHTIRLVGDDITVWGVKVQAPWNLPNTDGFDIRSVNATFYDDTVANGDQEIAIVSNGGETKNMTIKNFHGYNKGGITILGNGDSVSQILVDNAQITGDLPSVVSTTVDGKTEMVVNGVPYSQMKSEHHLKSWGQALPNATNNIKGLQITNQSSSSGAGSQISGVTFRSVCIGDIIKPINISLSNSSTPGFAHGILFQDVHVLKPTAQFPQMAGGVVSDPPAPGNYDIYFEAPLDSNGKPQSTNEITFDNLVFDDLSSTQSSIGSITALGNDFTAKTNAYPSVLYDLAQNNSPIDGVYLTVGYNKYVGEKGSSEPYLANACHTMPFITGDLSLSTNQQSAVVRASDSITLNAVVQPIMSQTTLFVPHSYGAKPGLLAIASPALTNAIQFYDNWTLIGSAKLSANGTLASFTIPHPTPGVHVFRAEYPADRYYRSLPFGLVTVTVQPSAR